MNLIISNEQRNILVNTIGEKMLTKDGFNLINILLNLSELKETKIETDDKKL